jgi:hypothetical protein
MPNTLKVGDRVYWWLAYGNRPHAKSCTVVEVKGESVICQDAWGRKIPKHYTQVIKNKRQ